MRRSASTRSVRLPICAMVIARLMAVVVLIVIFSMVAACARPGDIVLTLGAGDIHKAGPMLVKALGEAR